MKGHLFAFCTLATLLGCKHSPGPAAPGTVSVDGSGAWSLSFAAPAWTFGGQLPGAASDIVTSIGSDAVGSYHETSFTYRATTPKSAAIRLYDNRQIAIFREKRLADTPNEVLSTSGGAFPTLVTYPKGLHHLSYTTDQFSPFSFTGLSSDAPWFFFDDQANAFVLSPADHFMNARLYQTTDSPDSPIESGIDTDVQMLPSGFTQQTILVAEPGINRAFDTWGGALLALSGKSRPASDATVDLNTLGYWTDNMAAYYYTFDQAKGYPGTLLAVRDDFKKNGIPLGYFQIDSWWYPKGGNDSWTDRSSGEYTLTADAALFPSGLAGFQQALGLPLVTHARWIDRSSPYRSMYAMSNNVSVDPKFWKDVSSYLHENGVITYEQDWLDKLGLPDTTNLTDGDAFMDNMASAMQANGLSMQYCMPLPRHFLQSTKYPNLRTMRVTTDRFDTPRWMRFFYGSRLASALGVWPWVDVFYSTEEGNLLLATLSGGMVGVGDAIGLESAQNLGRAVRSDGVIVKPDAPIVPLDSSYVHGAQGSAEPLMASTYTDFGNGLRALYLFGYAQGNGMSGRFNPSEWGYSGDVFVYDYFAGSGTLMNAASAPGSAESASAFSYRVIVPVGPSGIAFLGDAGKYVSLGKKRIAALSDNGSLNVSVSFAAGEGAVTLHGYSPAVPQVSAATGSIGPVQFDPSSHLFSFTVTPSGDSATVKISR
jgi:hypothetical protein